MDDYATLLEVATPEELAELQRLLSPKPIPYCPWLPYPKQRAFLDLAHVREVMFGGAAGGSKSVALLMAALEYVDQPNYHALIVRRTFKQLIKADSIMELSKEWMLNTDAKWLQSDKKWIFPSGATLEFGHMDDENAKYNYQGPAYQYVGFDELTQFTETMYTYLFSRLRKRSGSDIPIRMRVTANPGGIGHTWVKERFITPKTPLASRVFVKSLLSDNFGLDQQSYIDSLSELDPITRKQLLEGDWDAYEGGRFKREWFRHTFRQTDHAYFLRRADGSEEEVAKSVCGHFTICDPAATPEASSDYTAIGAFAVTPKKKLLVLEVVRKRLQLEEIVPAIRDVALHNRSDYVGMEAVAFQWAMIHLARRFEDMPPVRAISASVNRLKYQQGMKGKLVRATPAIVKAEAGEIFLPSQAAWKDDYIAEHVLFSGDDKLDAFDDQVDMTAYGVIQVNFAMVPQTQSKEEPKPNFMSRLNPSRNGAQASRGMFGT